MGDVEQKNKEQVKGISEHREQYNRFERSEGVILPDEISYLRGIARERIRFSHHTGQRQRLLIARALAARPRIVIFDEATSALDDKAQALVMNSIRQIGITRIVVAHRLSTIAAADRILVFHEGRIVESGSYQNLLAAGGWFSALAQRQFHS